MTSPNKWSCLPTSAAMLALVPVEEFVHAIGHDGSEILWPDLPEPYRRRGFHIQEVIEVLEYYGFLLCPIEPRPCIRPQIHNVSAREITMKPTRMLHHLQYAGILVGRGPHGNPHAAYWDRKSVIDPMGTIYGIEKFQIQTFWRAEQF